MRGYSGAGDALEKIADPANERPSPNAGGVPSGLSSPLEPTGSLQAGQRLELGASCSA